MNLEEYRLKHDLTYEKLARILGMTSNLIFRICKMGYCVKMVHAQIIIKKTKGEVGFADLMPDDCV